MKLEFETHILSLEEELRKLEEKIKKDEKEPSTNSQYITLRNKIHQELEKVYNTLTPWNTTLVARVLERPQFLDYKEMIFTNFIEINGDKLEGNDKSIIGGFATIGEEKVVLLGQQRGNTVDEALKIYNRGMTGPNGYRKALRIMELANKFNLPIITFIDTPGADPGLVAEEKGQGEAIAHNLERMSLFEVPIICCVIGEGGSGGALALGVANTILMLQYAIYSVISPEGAAAILFRDGTLAPKAAEALKITAPQLYKLGLIDEIIPEPAGAAHRFPRIVSENLKQSLLKNIKELKKYSHQKIADRRLEKFLKYGTFHKNKI